MPVMQQPSAVPPPVWNGPRIATGMFPWQLPPVGATNVQPTAGAHRPLRRTLSSPVRRRYDVRGSLFGDVNRSNSPSNQFQRTAFSNSVTKRTSSPIEIPDSPSARSVISISSSSDEMEPNSMETNKTDQSLHSVHDNDGQEQCDVSEHEDEFGDDEDDDDCVVTSSFSVGSASPDLSETARGNADYMARDITTDDGVSSTTDGAANFSGDVEIPVGTFGECLTLNEGYANDSDMQHSFGGVDVGDGKTAGYGSDTESAEEKESTEISSALGAISGATAYTNNGLLSNQARTHEASIAYPNGQAMVTGDHVGRHVMRRHDHEGLHHSPTRVTRPSSLGVYPFYSQHPPVAAPTYVSPTVPFGPSQTVLITGNESRCCAGDSFQEPVLFLPNTQAQLVPPPIYSGMARIPAAAPVTAQLPFPLVTSAAPSSFVNPGFPQRLNSRGGYQAAVRSDLGLRESGYPGSSLFLNQRYQVPVVGAVKAINVVPTGAGTSYGQYLLNSSPSKARVYYP